jgi:hypothetical protein
VRQNAQDRRWPTRTQPLPNGAEGSQREEELMAGFAQAPSYADDLVFFDFGSVFFFSSFSFSFLFHQVATLFAEFNQHAMITVTFPRLYFLFLFLHATRLAEFTKHATYLSETARGRGGTTHWHCCPHHAP